MQTHNQQYFLPSYILVGGQGGQWFTSNQFPALYKLSFSNGGMSTTPLASGPVKGSVWSGGGNGTEWLITGWGTSNGLNPFLEMFNQGATSESHFSNYTQIGLAEKEWTGGDIFSATWNGRVWLLTGMGSGVLYSGEKKSNHYSMAFLTTNGTFIDISQSIFRNIDGILYTSSWDGEQWLVGGGRYAYNTGVLYLVGPSGSIDDISRQIIKSVPTFNAVQSIAWNGTDWMIGGYRFLADYNPTSETFYDLTAALNSVLSTPDSLSRHTINSVNSIAWTGNEWMIAGGVTVAFSGTENQTAWVASLNPKTGSFADLTSRVITPTIISESPMSSILSMSCNYLGCVLGGFAGDAPILLWYDGTNGTDLSSAIPIGGMTYVQWVGMSNSLSLPPISPAHHVLPPWPKFGFPE